MGAKRAKRRYDSRNNIINFQTHTHKQVQILPRNRNQETYMKIKDIISLAWIPHP